MVTAPNDDWTEELCIKLIHEYRKRPILWDSKDPNFFKKTLKPQAWEEIGEAIEMPADLCKHKMVILQSSFRREKSKIMQSIRESPDEAKFTSSWFAFEEMAFLIDKETERKRRQGEDGENSENGTLAIKRCLLEHYHNVDKKRKESKLAFETAMCKKTKHRKETTAVTAPTADASVPITDNLESVHSVAISSTMPRIQSVTSAPIASTIPRIQSVASAPIPSTIPPLTPARHREETLEEIKSFTNFIAYKMNKYSETTKNSVQQAICDIIFKADQNFYEVVSYEDNYNSYQSPDVISDDCDIDEKTIDIGNGQTITLHMEKLD